MKNKKRIKQLEAEVKTLTNRLNVYNSRFETISRSVSRLEFLARATTDEQAGIRMDMAEVTNRLDVYGVRMEKLGQAIASLEFWTEVMATTPAGSRVGKSMANESQEKAMNNKEKAPHETRASTKPNVLHRWPSLRRTE